MISFLNLNQFESKIKIKINLEDNLFGTENQSILFLNF